MRRAAFVPATIFALLLALSACGGAGGGGGDDPGTTCPPVEEASGEPLIDGDNPNVPGAQGGPVDDPTDRSGADGAPEVPPQPTVDDGVGGQAGAIDPSC